MRLQERDLRMDASEVRMEGGIAPDDAVDVVPALEEKLGKQRAVLPADPRNERGAIHVGFFMCVERRDRQGSSLVRELLAAPRQRLSEITPRYTSCNAVA